MTTQTSERAFGWYLARIASVAVVAALFLLMGEITGMRAMGVLLIAHGAAHSYLGQVPFGWKGQAPTGHWVGIRALAIGLMMGATGFALVVWPQIFIEMFAVR